MPVLGIDQTGAVYRAGRPRPLPAALLRDGRLEFNRLNSLDWPSVREVVGGADVRIALDCVLGLPQAVGVGLREAMAQTELVEGFGRLPAQYFFANLGRGVLHQREVEVRAKANSVFRDKPFQKNIQTGTFRLWKELARDMDWFDLPQVDTRRSGGIPIYEAYPSFSWRALLGASRREPLQLDRCIKAADLNVRLPRGWREIIAKDPNLADAAVIALHLAHLAPNDLERPPHPEGWIMGFR